MNLALAAIALGSAVLAHVLGAALVLAETDVRLKITTEGYTKIRIGFEEAKPKTEGKSRALYLQFLAILGKDLDMTGYFDANPNPESANAVVEIGLKNDEADLGFQVRLTDKASGQTIFNRLYGSASDGLTRTAHIVADDIVYALTGRPGIANTRIAFVAGPRSNSYIYTAGLDGEDPQRLTRTGTIVMSPSWSPQGSRLAYVSYEQGTPSIYVMDVTDLATKKFIAFEGLNATPAWSPDGKYLAVTLSKDGNPEIYVIAVDGSLDKRITYYSGIDCSPSWAPNGIEIAFTSDRAGTPQIFVTDTEGLYARQITTEGDYNTSPAWSPDGSLIAYVSRIDGKFQICTVDPFGVSRRVLTSSGSNEDPKWSADGMHLVFSSTGDGNSGIYIMTRDGRDLRRIIQGLQEPRNPAWSPSLGYGKRPPTEG